MFINYNKLIIIFSFISIGGESALSQHRRFKRIANGQPAIRADWKFLVPVVSGLCTVCGGTLIKQRWVLTAASCVIKDNVVYEQLGIAIDTNKQPTKYCIDLNLYLPKVRKRYIVHAVEAYWHKNYKCYTDEKYLLDDIQVYDIALLFLIQPVGQRSFNVVLAPIGKYTSVYDVCHFAGWGINRLMDFRPINILNDMDVKIINEARSLRILKQAFNETLVRYFANNTLIVEGVDYNNEQTIKFGDYGGPLLCNGFFVGIASTRLSATFSIFTNVGNYITWINSHLREKNTSIPSDGAKVGLKFEHHTHRFTYKIKTYENEKNAACVIYMLKAFCIMLFLNIF